MLLRSVTLLTCCLSLALTAEQEPPPLSVDEALARAVAHQQQIIAAAHSVEAAHQEAGALMAPTRPQINLGLSYERQRGTHNSSRLSDPGDSYSAVVSAQQLLYGFGTRAGLRARGRSGITSAEAQRRLTTREVAFGTRLALGSLLHARARVSIARARRDLRQEELDDATQLFKAGRINAIDVRQAEISLIQAEDLLKAEQGVLANSKQNLVPLLDLPASAFTITGNLTRIDDFTPLIAEASEALTAGNAETQVLDAGIGREQAGIRALSAGDRPQLYATARGSYGGDDLDEDRWEEGWTLGLALNWSYDGAGRQQQRASARARIRALESERQYTNDRNQATLQQLLIDRDTIAARILDQEKAIELSEQNYEDTRKLYSAGRVTLTRVTEANFAISQARFALNDLIFQENVIAYELLRLAE